MISQEILDTFVYETLDGKFGVNDPLEYDTIIGYYDTKIEAENALKEHIVKEKIEFV